jgi:hypothetical protein
VCKTDLVFLTDTSVDRVHRECIFYLCHSFEELKFNELRLNV